MVKKRKTKTDVISKKAMDPGLECPDTKNKTEQNIGHNLQLALEKATDSQENKMTKRGQKRKSIDPATDSSKLPKIALADETIIQASNIDHSEAKEDKKDPNNTVEHENIVTCILIKDAQVTYDKALGSDATHIPLKETEMSENDVRLEINKTLTEIRTTSADNKVMDSFDVGADESNERHFQHASDEDKAKTEAVLTEKMAESIENLLPIFLSQKTTGTNTKSLSVPQLNYLHKNLSDENVENHATDVKMHSLSSTCTSGKADIVSLNEKAIPVSIPDDTKLFVSTKDSIGDANTRSETNETLNNGKDTKCDELKQDNIIEITAETSQTVTGMMHTDIKTKVTCHVELELEQEESSTDTDINSKMNSCNKELPVVKVDKTDDSDLEKCPEIPATKDKIETETSLGDTTEQEAPYKEIDKAEKHEDNVEPIEDEETKEREAPDIDTIERENEMEELDKNEDDIDSIQSQPVSHIDEEIYLQSTAPVNPEYNGSKQDEENIADETGEGLDTDYDAVPPSLDTDYDTVLPRGLDTDYRYDAVLPRSPPAALHVTRDEVTFHSPRPADEAPVMPGNSTDDPAPRTATEVPDMLNDDDPGPISATEGQEMAADIGDDLTDSQLCAMDWSSQFPQESWYCVPQQSIVRSCLPPPKARWTGPQPSTRVKPEDGTAIMRGLIREVSQLNKMILKTKREMETERHQRHQTYDLNRR